MNTLINQNLGTAVGKVTAAEHRAVETAMLDYVAGQYIAGGSYHVGNGIANSLLHTFSLGLTLTNNQYVILGHFEGLNPNDTDWWVDADMMWGIESQYNDNFVVRFGEWSSQNQDVEFHWVALAAPGISPPPQ